MNSHICLINIKKEVIKCIFVAIVNDDYAHFL